MDGVGQSWDQGGESLALMQFEEQNEYEFHRDLRVLTVPEHSIYRNLCRK